MSNNEKILKEKIEGYINENGWNGFFGLLATISPQKMDPEDLKKYQEETENERPKEETKVEEESAITISAPKEASIYAKEHIPAVQEDLREQSTLQETRTNVIEEPKAKILTPPKQSTPNPWGESKVVLPGQLDLK